MTYHRVCNKSNTTGTTCGAVTAYPPEHLRSSLVLSGVRVARSLVFCVLCCRLLFVLLSLFFGYCIVCSSSDLRLLITPLISSNSSFLFHSIRLELWVFGCHLMEVFRWKESSWASSYCSWVYNYLCNQCLSPLTLWVRIPLIVTIDIWYFFLSLLVYMQTNL